MAATAKLFTSGGSQAVRLPKAFRFEGAEVHISREGDRVILQPVKPAPTDWDAVFARIDALAPDEPFPERRPQRMLSELIQRWRPD